MVAMILAAGRGERMKPLSDTTPKPLLKVAKKELIVWHLEKLASCGFKKVVINVAYLAQKIKDTLGDGSRYNLEILYSDESLLGALESGGGIQKALPLLGENTFLVLNGDIFCNYDFDLNFDLKDSLAHLILVPNPQHNIDGDFTLKGQDILNSSGENYTFSGIGYYHPKLFNNPKDMKYALAPLLRDAIDKRAVSGELFDGIWHDIGTPTRLENINRTFR